MTTGYGWNWSWVADTTNTKRSSDYVREGGGTIFSFRQPAGGTISSSDLSAFSRSVMQNQQKNRSDWRTYIHPILDSLPSGSVDTRWSTDLGRGLPEKIDCFSYGIQGTTLFVFNDADDTKADGRYWVDDQYRPKTIAEAFEDVYEALHNIETGISTDSDTDLDPLWASIGEEYRDATFRGATGSLHARTSLLDTYVQQLNTDIYEPNSYPYSLGSPLPHSIASMLDELLKIHQIPTGWGSDPSNVGHDAMPIPDHTHPYTDVVSPPPVTEVQDRLDGTYTSLTNDIKRLRYEVQTTRGSSNWYSDVTDPVTAGAGDLGTHLSYQGSGTVTSSNPHAISISDTGAETIFNNVISFTGMTNTSDSSPTYSDTTYVTQGASLETAVGELDLAISNLAASGLNAVRLDYTYNRTEDSETDRAQSPITINHNIGRKPIVDAVDISPTQEDYYGQYSSPAVDLNVVHLDKNTLEIWTSAAVIEVIIIG